MQPFTLRQAVIESKKAKTTILDAIKKGKLSADKDEHGRYKIDPSELFRVYPPTSHSADEKTTFDHNSTINDQAIFELKIENLQEQLKRERELNNDLKNRFDALEKRLDSLMMLITHQTPAQKKTQTSSLWHKVFKR